MKVQLLYPDREWKGKGRSYYGFQSIIDDLGLNILFQTASRNQEEQTGNVQNIAAEDRYLGDTLRTVMMVPLETAEEIYYRQDILKDFINCKEFLGELYQFSKEVIFQWEKIGRKEGKETTFNSSAGTLITKLRQIELFTDKYSQLKEMTGKYKADFQSEGLLRFVKGLEEEFNTEFEEKIRGISKDLAFFFDSTEEEHGNVFFLPPHVNTPRIVLECRLRDGMKLGQMKVESVESKRKRYRKTTRKRSISEICLSAFAPEAKVLMKDDYVVKETKQMEKQVVEYILNGCNDFLSSAKMFFEQLEIQSGFYQACYNLYQKSVRLELDTCYPKVCKKEDLEFSDLTEFSMAIYKRIKPVDNTLSAKDKLMLIVTGANQGGKSTFLRSIGIAQIMMQCGMFVSASAFSSGIFKGVFTHFTKREDSAMNSGRLDEEMRRMKTIVDHLEENTLVLLNESFATTTEKEGAVIAYDITKALTEQNVKVLTVTHLLAFAKRVYEEPHESVTFLSAERKADGNRTYKMVSCKPEFTSFGLDLYNQIINEK